MTAAAAHPTVKTAEPIPISEGELPVMDPNEAAKLDQVIRSYAEKDRYSWYGLGEAARVIRESSLWKMFAPDFGEDPFHGFDDYLERRGQRSKSQIYQALKLRSDLDDLDEQDCKMISRQNAIWLSRYVTRIKKEPTKTMIEKAKSMKEKLFSEYVNDQMPGAAREEVKQSITFSACEKSLAKVVDEAIVVAMWDAEVEDKRDALERICTFYLESACEHEGLHKLSNREAWAKAHGKVAKKKKVN